MSVVDQSRWRFVATDLAGNTSTGGGQVMNSSQKQYSHHKNAGKTIQFTLNIDNPVAPFLLSNDSLIKVYRRTKLAGLWQRLMIGDVIQVDESAQGDVGLMTVVAADPWWRLQRRLIGMGIDSIGRGTGYSDASVGALIDNSYLLRDIINAVNSVFNSGVQLGTVSTCGTTGYIGPVYAQNAGELMQQICNTLGGPDFELAPLEPFGLMPSTIIAQMNIYAALGQVRPNTIFEYGTGKRDVATYDRILSKDGLCNQAYSPPAGFPSVNAAGDTMVIGQDIASQSAVGLYQDIVQSDVSATNLRQELANEYVQVRKYARQQITFTPSVDCNYDYNVDYSVGDTVGARAYVGGSYRYNGTARIYGVDIAVDDNDAETPSLTLIPGG